MRPLAQIVLTGTSCAVFLLTTIAASDTAAAAAVGTSAASFGADDNRVNSKRLLAVESLPQYSESKRDEFVETADLSNAPADLHGLLQSEPAGGLTLSNLRGGQQEAQQVEEEVNNFTGKDEAVVVLHDIFDRFDQIPELAARKGAGGGSSRSKGSKGSGSRRSTGKGSKSKGSKGGSSSDSNKGKGGTKSSKGSSTNTKNSSSSKKKSSRESNSSSSKKSDGNKKKKDGENKKSSSESKKQYNKHSSNSKQTNMSTSKLKKSSPSKKKPIKKKTNSQRMCLTPAEKSCRNNCIDNKCDASDDESSPCAKRCRYKCCSDLQSNDRSKKNGKKVDEERSCNTMEEKTCRSKCFYKKKCRDDECKRQCRRDCCVGGRIGNGSKTNDKKSDGESGSADDNKKKGAGTGDGGDEDGKGCDTDVEKQCRDTCYIESSCQNGDRECRKTCRQGCCDVDLSVVDIISNAQEQGGNSDDDGSFMSGDLPLSFRFTISTAERFTADDIMNGRDNSLKEDLEGGLKILVEDVVGDAFRGDGWKDESRRGRRRKLVVRYQSDSPPTVEDVQDVSCPPNVGGSGCKRVRAEATLELEDENENSVRQAFLSAISEAISDGRLESAIRQFNPDHGSRDPLSNNPGSSNDGGDGRSLTNIQIAGIAVGALAFVVLSYLALKICQDRRRGKEERSIQGGSAPGSVSQQEARYEDDAYHDAYGGDHYEDQRLPPIPEPPQLPDRSSGKPRESKLAAVRRNLQADPYEPHTPERALEAGGPSLVDLVATSYTPKIEEATATNENFDSTHQPSELSDEYYDDVQPSEGAAHTQLSENTLDQYADHEPTASEYGPPPSPHRYEDGGQGQQGDRLDLSAPIDFSQQQAAMANDYVDDNAQEYEEDYQEYTDPEYMEGDYYQEQYDVEDTYQQQGEEYYDDAQYHEQPMATDSWGERKHASQYDYQGGDGYDEAPPEVAESDVSSKEEGEGGGGAMTETSSQNFIETAKRMAAAEQNDPQSVLDNDAIEDISDRSDDEEAHSQARAYRHRAQAERIGRKSRVSDLINRFESS